MHDTPTAVAGPVKLRFVCETRFDRVVDWAKMVRSDVADRSGSGAGLPAADRGMWCCMRRPRIDREHVREALSTHPFQLSLRSRLAASMGARTAGFDIFTRPKPIADDPKFGDT